jgi:hypothetical protein
MNILIEYSHFAEGVELCEEEENENVIEGNFTHKQAIKEAS